MPNTNNSPTATPAVYILRLEPYDGDSSYLDCGIIGPVESGDGIYSDDRIQTATYAIVQIGPLGAALVDLGYESIEQARDAWPEAIPPQEHGTTTATAAKSDASQSGGGEDESGLGYSDLTPLEQEIVDDAIEFSGGRRPMAAYISGYMRAVEGDTEHEFGTILRIALDTLEKEDR